MRGLFVAREHGLPKIMSKNTNKSGILLLLQKAICIDSCSGESRPVRFLKGEVHMAIKIMMASLEVCQI